MTRYTPSARSAWIRSLWRDAYARVRIGRGSDFLPANAFRDPRERAALAAYAALRAEGR